MTGISVDHLDVTTKGIETVRCNLCGADETRTLYKLPVQAHEVGVYQRDIWDVVQCKNCGLIYENPRPDRTALEFFYSFESPEDHQFVQEWFINNADLSQASWQRILRAMSRYSRGGKLLDVGCAAGGFLVEARKFGFEVSGLDISPFFVDYCQTKLGLKVYESDLESLPEEATGYECITAFDVIEHHPDPLKLLSEIRRRLKKDGLVVIGTHDIGNVFARLYGARWRHLYAIGHLTYFTRSTLAAMLAKSGFRVVRRGGAHTIDRDSLSEYRNAIGQFLKLILLRGLVIGVYRPVTSRIPTLARWQFRWGEATINHAKLLRRAGNQLIMNDNMILLAKVG